MAKHSFLLEVGVEEMPAHVVTPSENQLKNRVAKYLKDSRISFGDIKEFSTPRRMALLISDLADKQPDLDSSVKGPAKKIAQDADGNWTKAAIGFTRGQGMTVDDITFKDVKGTQYVFVEKHVPGKPVADVLQGLNQVITSMNFPTMMRWGTHKLEFIRPIRWLVALLDDQIVPFSILDVKTGRTTRGHRFLGHDVDLKTATDYEQVLHDDYVIVDAKKRKQLIEDQMNKIADDHHWKIDSDPDLLEEVNNLVEWPTAFAGSFDPKYLELPEAVLITSMRDNQRFFCVRDADGKLQPNFISVRNGNAKYLDNVIKGNERVLVPRLEDAKFFYSEDQKFNIDQYVERLKRVSFHDKISSVYDKMQRVAVIAKMLGQELHLSDDELADLDRAAHIYKFDLTTQMVGEFAELQGVMGEIYAKLFGEKDAVALAIREQYMPTSAEGELPQSKLGAILSIADKLDSVIAFFAVGMIPSGSNDPYALRRQAYGIVRIIADRNWHFTHLMDAGVPVADAWQEAGLKVSFDPTKNSKQVRSFFLDRLRQLFGSQRLRHDIVDAVTDTSNSDIANVIASAYALDSRKDNKDFKDQIEALTRVMRIAKKADKRTPAVVDSSKFEHPSETKLNNAVTKLQSEIAGQTPAQTLDALLALEPIISDYFEENMVMAKDPAIRTNRLSQLSILSSIIFRIGNLDKLIVK